MGSLGSIWPIWELGRVVSAAASTFFPPGSSLSCSPFLSVESRSLCRSGPRIGMVWFSLVFLGWFCSCVSCGRYVVL